MGNVLFMEKKANFEPHEAKQKHLSHPSGGHECLLRCSVLIYMFELLQCCSFSIGSMQFLPAVSYC